MEKQIKMIQKEAFKWLPLICYIYTNKHDHWAFKLLKKIISLKLGQTSILQTYTTRQMSNTGPQNNCGWFKQ